MREIKQSDFRLFASQHERVTVGEAEIRLRGHQNPKVLEPVDFKLETTTLWSFPKRGNWAPQIARNLILRYSRPGDLILDQMVGGGTTLVECRLTGRNAIGVDINYNSLMVAMDRLNFPIAPPRSAMRQLPLFQGRHETSNAQSESQDTSQEPAIRLFHGDARNLDLISDDSIDLVATHPPYSNIIQYSRPGEANSASDLSRVQGITIYLQEMHRVAYECYRVLKPGQYCAILMGDTRRNRHYVPMAFYVMLTFLRAGFILKEDIIKAQWNTGTEGLWARLSRDRNFFLIAHEHLFVFRKPLYGESSGNYLENTYPGDNLASPWNHLPQKRA